MVLANGALARVDRSFLQQDKEQSSFAKRELLLFSRHWHDTNPIELTIFFIAASLPSKENHSLHH